MFSVILVTTSLKMVIVQKHIIQFVVWCVTLLQQVFHVRLTLVNQKYSCIYMAHIRYNGPKHEVKNLPIQNMRMNKQALYINMSCPLMEQELCFWDYITVSSFRVNIIKNCTPNKTYHHENQSLYWNGSCSDQFTTRNYKFRPTNRGMRKKEITK